MLKTKKMANHSSRATAVSNLAKAGIGEQLLIQVTGHANAKSIQPYLQVDQEHHENIISVMRNSSTASTRLGVSTNQPSTSNVYNNCTFNCNNLYINK
jgi:hypothetical protein